MSEFSRETVISLPFSILGSDERMAADCAALGCGIGGKGCQDFQNCPQNETLEASEVTGDPAATEELDVSTGQTTGGEAMLVSTIPDVLTAEAFRQTVDIAA